MLDAGHVGECQLPHRFLGMLADDRNRLRGGDVVTGNSSPQRALSKYSSMIWQIG